MAGKIIMSQGEITELLQVSRPTVTKYTGLGMPLISRGKYDAAAVVSWFVEHKKKLAFDNTGEKSDDIDEMKRLTSARADKVERENDEATSKLLSRDVVEAFASTSGIIVNNAFESLGARLCNQLAGLDDPAEIQSVLHGECRDTLMAITEKALAIGLEMEDAETSL